MLAFEGMSAWDERGWLTVGMMFIREITDDRLCCGVMFIVYLTSVTRYCSINIARGEKERPKNNNFVHFTTINKKKNMKRMSFTSVLGELTEIINY